MRNKKIIILVFLLIVCFVGIIILLFNYYSSGNRQTKMIDKKIVTENDEDNKTDGELTPAEKLSISYMKSNKAAVEKKIDLCFELEDSPTVDNCIYKYATRNNDSGFCDKINDENLKIKCQEIFIVKQIINEDDIEKCNILETEIFKDQCLIEFYRKWDDIEKCRNYDEDLCKDIIYSKLASQLKDMEVCEKIKQEDYKINCKKALSSLPEDTDGDGLSDSEEKSYGFSPFSADSDKDGLNDGDELKIYHTNPLNSDTDGDGYTDGDEVKNGYNPKGEGRLEI